MIVIQDRHEFMHHAYNAMLSGQVMEFRQDLKVKMVDEVIMDIGMVIRSLPDQEREAYMQKFALQLRPC